MPLVDRFIMQHQALELGVWDSVVIEEVACTFQKAR